MIETIWNLNKDWEGLWGDWKGNQFTQLQTENMENSSQSIFKKLNRMSKELKVRGTPDSWLISSVGGICNVLFSS